MYLRHEKYLHFTTQSVYVKMDVKVSQVQLGQAELLHYSKFLDILTPYFFDFCLKAPRLTTHTNQIYFTVSVLKSENLTQFIF